MIFYSRAGCHLCDEALPVARRVARLFGRRLEIVDIDTDDELIVDYGLRIPVLVDEDGAVIGEGRISLFSAVRAMFRA